MAVDTEGYLYVTSRIGLQVCDQPGGLRRSSISRKHAARECCLPRADFQTL